MFNPDINDYQLTSIITECCGGVAVVYSALYKPSNQNVAIKRYFVDKTKENASLIQQDIATRKELQHPNILPYLTSFVHGRELYVVSPLMTFGSCRDILDRYFPEGLPELACAIILRDVLLALQYLHKQLYIHRSVRASHVLVGANGGVRLSGLRSAASMMLRGRRQKQLHNLPPPDHDNVNLMWLSPELLEQNLKGYDARSDMYSLGVLCCELANGAVPFAEIPTTLMFTEKVRGSRPQLLDCSTFPEPCLEDGEMKNEFDTPLSPDSIVDISVSDPLSDIGSDNVKGMYNTDSGVGDSEVARARLQYARRKLSDAFHQLTEMALQRDPDKRPTATQLLNHAFFKQVRKTDFLPGLISKVKPIKPDPSDMSALLLQQKMAEMEIEKTTEWDF
ncbi:STE20-related kinase adapter protein alpha isoform X1 [Plodia interpunctella]|uniref:STE20-related kinase adapter protein alpha isoform X1 n=1 Tax=Plodia interpunctella TaxID=58824 RepID=UPI00236784C2|nr:STE20-related kinase adapter protein alpha isoform X1 [Plodia interpunctella]